MIEVFFKVRPRHSKGEWVDHRCRDYGDTIGFEARLCYRVRYDAADMGNVTGRPETTGRKIWIHQVVHLRASFFDSWGNLCGTNTGDADEYFSVDPGDSATRDDDQGSVWDVFGFFCPSGPNAPCRMVAAVQGTLTPVYLANRGEPAHEFLDGIQPTDPAFISGNKDYVCNSGAEVRADGTGRRMSTRPLSHCDAATIAGRIFQPMEQDQVPTSDAANAPLGPSLRRKHGTARYAYGLSIDHCAGDPSVVHSGGVVLRRSIFSDDIPVDPPPPGFTFRDLPGRIPGPGGTWDRGGRSLGPIPDFVGSVTPINRQGSAGALAAFWTAMAQSRASLLQPGAFRQAAVPGGARDVGKMMVLAPERSRFPQEGA
jgi:hypothetical protein